jgi:GT2 family glycosyltransferase
LTPFANVMFVGATPHLTFNVDLSVIIVNWRSATYLQHCLASLYRETHGIPFEVIVVDNASYDGCDRMIREEFPKVVFFQSHRNLGFAGGNNLGFLHSSGDILLFLNPDTEIIGDALVKMSDYLRNTPSAGAVGPRLLNTDGSLQTSCVRAFPTLWNQILDSDRLRRSTPTWTLWGMAPLFRGDSRPAQVEAISGACFMVKRDVFARVGSFGEEYFMYSDDLDLSYRIHQAGYSIVYMNDCQVIHHGGKSSEQQGHNFSDIQQRQSLAYFFGQTRGQLYASVYRGAMVCTSIARIVLLVCLIPFGGRGIEKKNVSTALRKWSTILRWSLGGKRHPVSQKRA